MERQQLGDKERWRKETAARIRDTKAAMAQLAGEGGGEGGRQRAWFGQETVGEGIWRVLRGAEG
jgi:hypothetical protein